MRFDLMIRNDWKLILLIVEFFKNILYDLYDATTYFKIWWDKMRLLWLLYNWEHDFNCAVNLDSGNVALYINVYIMCLFNLIIFTFNFIGKRHTCTRWRKNVLWFQQIHGRMAKESTFEEITLFLCIFSFLNKVYEILTLYMYST